MTVVYRAYCPKCAVYVNRIRNVAKQEYARRMAVFLHGNAPAQPQPRTDLSTMAVQAVRMRLLELHEGDDLSNLIAL